MIKQTILWLFLVGMVGCFAPGQSMADEIDDDDARNCIPLRKLTSTLVIDERNILFFMVGKTVYHNALPKQCPGLAREGRFKYTTLGNSLCVSDSVQVLQGDVMGRTCRLGRFRPVTRDDILAIAENLRKRTELDPPPTADIEEIGVETESKDDPTSN